MTALEVGWLIFHVLSYLTTVLVPDFGNLNSKWVCGCSQPFWIWPLTCNNLFQQKKKNKKNQVLRQRDCGVEAEPVRRIQAPRAVHGKDVACFSVGGLLWKYLWKYIAIVGRTRSPACYFWHNLEGGRCLEQLMPRWSGISWQGEGPGSWPRFSWLEAITTMWVSYSTWLQYRRFSVHREIPTEHPQMNPRGRVLQLTPSLNLCFVKTFFKVSWFSLAIQCLHKWHD